MAYHKHIAENYIRGLTLVELLIVMAIIAIVASAIMSGFMSYGVAQELQVVKAESTTLVREARQRTIASETDTQFGVHVATSTITVFEGANFTTGVVRSEFTSQGTLFASTFSDGSNEIVFSRLTGLPSATGTIMLTQTRSNDTITLEILDNGMIQY